MHTYRPNTPRATLGLAAVALTVATIGLSVIAPSRMDFRSQQVPAVVLSQGATVALTETTPPLVDSIDVVAQREQHLVTVVQSRHVQQRLRG